MKEIVLNIRDKNGTLLTVVSVGKTEIDGFFDIDGRKMVFTAENWITQAVDLKIIDFLKNEGHEQNETV